MVITIKERTRVRYAQFGPFIHSPIELCSFFNWVDWENRETIDEREWKVRSKNKVNTVLLYSTLVGPAFPAFAYFVPMTMQINKSYRSSSSSSSSFGLQFVSDLKDHLSIVHLHCTCRLLGVTLILNDKPSLPLFHKEDHSFRLYRRVFIKFYLQMHRFANKIALPLIAMKNIPWTKSDMKIE